MGGIFSIQIGDGLTGRCWDCCAGRAAYACHLEDNLEALQTTTERLTALKEDLMRRVRVQEQQQMKRLKQVEWWLKSVDSATAKGGDLLKDREQLVQKLCFGGCCSKNCWSTYKFGKKIDKTLKTLVELKEVGEKFELVAEKAPVEEPLVAEMPCEPTVGLETKLAEVWSCLSEEDVGIVGLYGIGGVGKTTLLAQINNQFVGISNHCLVIWVVVSKDLRLERIQEEIGQKIGFSGEHWRKKSIGEKAVDIFNALRKKNFVLLLDDLWQRVKLTEIGIPPLEKLNGSKVIFTTRSMDVCGQMGAQRRIRVEVLEWEQAWKLFQKNVGEETINIHPGIPSLARSVARRCGGLPLALITIGRAMSGKKEPREWHHAIEIFKKSARHLQDMETEVLSLLKFSYDNLPIGKARSCFLYCALFPEDFNIDKDELIDLWIYKELSVNCDEGIDSRDEAYSIMGTLVRACLLEEERSEYVKLHDVIREMALWITKKDTLVLAGIQLKEAPEVERWEGVRRLSLMQNCIEKLTEVPSCPNLVTLLLSENRKLYKICDDFFQFMSSLTVLDLSKTALRKLPSSISKLVSLEYLNISYTEVKELPVELRELAKLKYLNLSALCVKTRKSDHLISKLSSLQVLRMLNCQYSYEGGEEEAIGAVNRLSLYDDMLFQELQCLKYLKALAITIRCVATLESFLVADELLTRTENLCLRDLKGSKWLDISLLTNVKHLNLLRIGECDMEELHVNGIGEGKGALGSVFSSSFLRDKSFNSLRVVAVRKCHHLRDLTWLILVPNLVSLFVGHCNQMEEIISGKKLGEGAEMAQNLIPFSKLEFLQLRNLPQLKYIYQNALPFLFLEKIEIISCPLLKKLPVDPNSKNGRQIKLKVEEDWWKAIEWEDEATKAAFLPRINCYSV